VHSRFARVSSPRATAPTRAAVICAQSWLLVLRATGRRTVVRAKRSWVTGDSKRRPSGGGRTRPPAPHARARRGDRYPRRPSVRSEVRTGYSTRERTYCASQAGSTVRAACRFPPSANYDRHGHAARAAARVLSSPPPSCQRSPRARCEFLPKWATTASPNGVRPANRKTACFRRSRRRNLSASRLPGSIRALSDPTTIRPASRSVFTARRVAVWSACEGPGGTIGVALAPGLPAASRARRCASRASSRANPRRRDSSPWHHSHVRAWVSTSAQNVALCPVSVLSLRPLFQALE